MAGGMGGSVGGKTGGDLAHLHVKSGFSYGHGVATPAEFAQAAAGMGMGAIALTDRDVLYGVPCFLAACGETGISPIVGAEVSVEGGGHLVLLAENMEGYRSLCRLVTSYRESSGLSAAERRSPSCALETLLEHHRGLVCLTGAIPFGLLPRLVLDGGCGEAYGVGEARRKARETLGLLKEAFGCGRLYAELTDDKTAGSRRRMAAVQTFAEACSVPVLAAQEVTYLSPADHRLHEVLMAATNLTALPGPGYPTYGPAAFEVPGGDAKPLHGSSGGALERPGRSRALRGGGKAYGRGPRSVRPFAGGRRAWTGLWAGEAGAPAPPPRPRRRTQEVPGG